ncbi:putative spermidine/putrescine transport system permease protein [Leifsonia sp. 98AMF]|nr:putative spermidine/putrescine transport system permease protein [Leifsonia sp. 197AMF]SDI90020.1 putative spermidine/putrescine transport system permease protein [Leifsonia sp. 466MF]SDJ90445.1 putative spermidine/putrescine transport system permease protein [Leifsonia sp. 157MF]SDN93719.1 putative spermidine/putrescine transport system permease protein [Leifsonia sp. 509MF]SEN11971.1 putative spermidine/putrescine transport system permease protein [Leifsonia sp. 467MF]SFM03244.1 putative 
MSRAVESRPVRPRPVRRRAPELRLGPGPVVRAVIWTLLGLFFLIPLFSMVEFTLRTAKPGVYNLDRWVAVFSGETTRYDRVYQGLGNSLVLAVVTVAIVLLVLLPTIVLVELRFPKLRRLLEGICLLPIMIPAIVMVVGLAPTYAVVTEVFGSGAWTLAFAYGITVLPYAYRAIQSNVAAVDMITLSEAARSLGAGWWTVFWRVLVPNLRRGILAASALSVAVVLGEFTIASLLSRVNLQTSLLLVSQSDPFVAVIFALLALVFAFVLLVVVDRLVSVRRRTAKG